MFRTTRRQKLVTISDLKDLSRRESDGSVKSQAHEVSALVVVVVVGGSRGK